MAQGELRIGCCQSTDTDHFGECLGWYCFHESKPCLLKTFSYKKFPNPRITAISEIRDFERLGENDQGRLRQLVETEPPTKKQRVLPDKVNMQVLLDSDFSEKDEVKALGARWDRDLKSWYVAAGMALEPFAKWINDESLAKAQESEITNETQESPVDRNADSATSSTTASLPETSNEDVFLKSTFAEKDTVKALGARWDSSRKSWFVPSGTPLAPFAKWIDMTPRAVNCFTEHAQVEKTSTVVLPEASSEPVLLKSAFSDKDEVKSLGARWNREQSSWYVPAGMALNPFAKWIVPEAAAIAMKTPVAALVMDTVAKVDVVTTPSLPETSTEPVLLRCAFSEKEQVKLLGARWDPAQSGWFVPAGKALAPFSKWIPQEAVASAAKTPTAVSSSVVEPAKPSGKPKKLPQTKLKSIQKEEKKLESSTALQLKDMLKLNDQTTTGAKPELVSKVAEGIVLGAIPRCPSCSGGKPNFDRTTGLYSCKGHMDDATFIQCQWSSYDLKRTPWQTS